MVTTEPSGTMAWMPLNNHASVKPTYDFHTTINYDPAAGARPSTASPSPTAAWSRKVVNAPDANFPTAARARSTGTRPEPIASYLVENSVGHFDESERMATAGDVIYYEYQATGIAAARKATNKAIMDMQEDITHFQERVQRAVPVQRQRHRHRPAERLLRGGDADEDRRSWAAASAPPRRRFSHENMHQWWGDNVSYAQADVHVLQGGLRRPVASTCSSADIAGKAAGAGGLGRVQRGVRGVDRSRFNGRPVQHDQHVRSGASRRRTRRRANLFGSANTYTRPGHVLHRAARDPRQRPTSSRPARRSRPTYSVRLDHASRRRSRSTTSTCRTSRTGCHEQARRVLQAVVGHGLHGLARRPATSRRSRARAWPAAASMTPTAAARTTASTARARAAAPSRRRCPDARRSRDVRRRSRPGVAKDYTADHDRQRHLHRGRRDAVGRRPERDRAGPPGQRRVLAADGAEGRRHQPGAARRTGAAPSAARR